MKTLTVDVILISPSGRQISMALVADEAESDTIISLIDNAEEMLTWLKAERLGGPVANGYMN